MEALDATGSYWFPGSERVAIDGSSVFDPADGTRAWSLMQLERQLRPEVYGRRRGGYIDRRRTPAADA
jgi:hypothetical protein